MVVNIITKDKPAYRLEALIDLEIDGNYITERVIIDNRFVIYRYREPYSLIEINRELLGFNN